MGTNFYYRIPIKSRKIKELQNLITKNPNFDKLKDEIYKIENKNNIHLGKRSYGWQFLWDYHKGEFYQPNLKSIKDFLSNGIGEIYDEYGQAFGVDEFFNDEIKDFLYLDDKHCNIDTYVDPDGHSSKYRGSNFEFTSDDGLRFSHSENFS